jgi:hypothetical protein
VDWIEQWTGYSPDNGDGSFEFLIMLAVAVTLVSILILWRIPGAYTALRRLMPLSQDMRKDRRS